MRVFGLILLLFLTSVSIFGQGDAEPTPTATPELTDRQLLDRARGFKNDKRRVVELEKFSADNPDSDLLNEAAEYLTVSRASLAEKLLEEGKSEEGIALLKKAVEGAPKPAPEALFRGLLIKIPTNLYLRGKPKEALDIADVLEVRSEENASRLIRLAAFHIAIKYATGARRLAEKAVRLDPESAPAHKVLADAARLGFDLQTAVDSYEVALEKDPDNLLLKQSLAEMRRALGQPDAAISIYKEIVEADKENVAARTGVILCLLDLGNKEEGKRQLISEVSENPSNVFAMIGAANWFVSNGEPDLAIDFANQALILDEKQVWPYIIIGRAHTIKNQPEQAERFLIQATRYSALPTLSLELALTHLKSGSYRSAIVAARTAFTLEDEMIVTSLDRRVGVEAETFVKSVILERKSFLFSGDSGVSKEEDDRLKALLKLDTLIRQKESSAEDIQNVANEFISGDDKMRGYRRLFVADLLLEMGREPEFAARVAGSAIEDAEQSVKVVNASMAVMSDALFPRRFEAAQKGTVILAPNIESSVIERIFRGKIEMLSGRSAFNRKDYGQAELRLKRAVSVLPRDSAWWKSGKWLLGQTKEQQNEDKEALRHFADSYRAGFRPTEVRTYIEAVYKRVNGNTDGLEEYLEKGDPAADDPGSLLLKRPVATAPPKVDEEKAGKEVEKTDVIPSTVALKSVEVEGSNEKPATRKLDEDLILDFTKLPGPVKPKETTTPKEIPLAKKTVETTPEKSSNAETKPDKPTTVETKPVETKPTPAAIPVALDPKPKSDSEKPVADEKEVVSKTVDEDAKKLPVTDASTDLPKATDSVVSRSGVETKKEPETKVDEKKTVVTEAKVGEDTESGEVEDTIEIKVDRNILTGAERPRIVASDKVKKDEDESTECRFVLSQKNVSMFVNGGSFGIFVGLVNYDEAYVLRARSLNPEHVTVEHEPDIGSLQKRAFFVFKSISEEKGDYEVEFESPCGRKVVKVSVY